MDILEAFRVTTESIKAWADKRFLTINSRLDDIEQGPFAINSFKNTVYDKKGIKLAGPLNTTIVEIGQTVTKIDFFWDVSRKLSSQTVNGTNLPIGDRTISFETSFSDTKPGDVFTYSMSATDEKGTAKTSKTYVKFLNGVYYGVLADGATIDDATILSAVSNGLLKKELRTDRFVTFNKTAAAGQKFAFIAPVRYGEVTKFVVNGLGYQWAQTKINFTNSSGYLEEYYVWVNDEVVVGTREITVK